MPLNNADNLIYIFNFHPQHNYSSDLLSITIPSRILRYIIDYTISSYMNYTILIIVSLYPIPSSSKSRLSSYSFTHLKIKSFVVKC